MSDARVLVPGASARATALASAIVAVVVVSTLAQYVDGYQRGVLAAEQDRRGQEVAVPVLLRSRALGEVIAAEDIGWRRFPLALIPAGTVRSADALVGRTAVEPVLAGELVRVERLSAPDAEPGLQAVVSPGLRAMSFDLRDADRLAGLVAPGARVDVLATLPADGAAPVETITLIEAAEVLAVSERVFTNTNFERIVRPNVTLALSPSDAERVAAVPGEGQSLKLTLRGDLDFSL